MRYLVIAALLVSCGGTKDDCERIYDKLSSSIPAFHADKTKWLANCHADPEPLTTDAKLACTLTAESAQAVRACMGSTYNHGDELERFAADEDTAAAAKAKATQMADEAAKAAGDAMQRIEALEKDLGDLNKRVDDAVDKNIIARTDADLAAAKSTLRQLRAQKAEMERRIAEAKAAAARAERTKGVTISKECMDNPLAKGCM